MICSSIVRYKGYSDSHVSSNLIHRDKCILQKITQKFWNSTLGIVTASGHPSQSNEFCSHNPVHRFSEGVCLCAISQFVMADVQEKHICFKCCLKLGKTAAETHGTAVGDSAVGRTRSLQTFEWYSRFRLGHPSVAGCLRCFECYIIFVKKLFVQARRLAGITIARFCKVWGSKSCENCWKNGGTGTGWVTVTMRRRTLLCQSRNFCLPNPWLWPTPPHPPNSRYLTSKVASPRSGILATRASFPETVADRLYTIPKCRFQRCFQQVRECWARCITRKGTTA